MLTTVFLTGATGTMGFAGMTELLRRSDKYRVKVLARPSAKNKELLSQYQGRVEVVWGDLLNYDDVLRGVTGSDVVLHVGGMVSPQADYKPRSTRKVNIGAAENVVKAVLAQPEEKQPRVVYIGSVAQLGDHREPLHWGRAGDPIQVAVYDHYGLTKVMAERIIAESGIKRWVSLRQSGILYPAILRNYDPIMFHVPIRGCLEWATVEDSGRLLERVCRPDVPAKFWNNYYNIGSGKEYRLSNYEFECLLLDAIGCPKPEQIFNANWFTTRNFHGMWYIDGDKLEDMLHFRANVPVKAYFAQMAKADSLPWGIKFASKTHIAKLFPHCVKAAMWFMANSKEHGTQWWVKMAKGEGTNGERARKRIAAYYGSLEAYNAIPDWKHMDLSHNSETPVLLDHGYDESKDVDQLTDAELNKAAAFRGGKYLGNDLWEDANGNQFKAGRRLILLGGHWSPFDMPYPYAHEPQEKQVPWHWDRVAQQNPFFAQLWAPLHDASEDNIYGPEIFEGWEK